MYLGIITVVLGLALLFWSPALLIYAGCVWIVMELYLHLFEEPGLQRRFGDDYEVYRQTTSRWLGWPSGTMTRRQKTTGPI